MASEEETTSDSCNVSIRPVPKNLLPYVRSRVLHYVNEAKDFSAEIHQTSETDARLVFYHGAKSTEERATESVVDGDHETATGNTIIVRKIPQSVDEDLLEMFFESGKKVGAGPVKSVQLNRQKNWAIVEFCESGAVETVMSKKPLTLLDTTLDVHPYAPLLQGDESINSLEIRGLPSELTQDILSVQTEEIPDLYAASKTDEAVVSYNPERPVVTGEETISDLQPVQLKMLSVTKFPDTEEQKCSNVKVKIDHSKNEIVFKGDKVDIMHTKMNMFETLSKFSIRVLNIPERHAELFRANQVQIYIAKKLETKNLVCTWEVKVSELVICSYEADIVSCVSIVSGSVKEEEIRASSDSVGTLYSCQWPARLTAMHNGSWFIFKVHSYEYFKMIHLISADNISSEVVRIVKEFLRSKAKVRNETFYDYSPVASRVFQALKCCPAVIRKWLKETEKELSIHYVSIQTGESTLKLEGTWEGIALAKARLTSL